MVVFIPIGDDEVADCEKKTAWLRRVNAANLKFLDHRHPKFNRVNGVVQLPAQSPELFQWDKVGVGVILIHVSLLSL